MWTFKHKAIPLTRKQYCEQWRCQEPMLDGGMVLCCRQAAWLTTSRMHVWCFTVDRQPGSPRQACMCGAWPSNSSLPHRAMNELAGSALEAPTCLKGMPVASAKVPVPKPVAIMVMLTCSRKRNDDTCLQGDKTGAS